MKLIVLLAFGIFTIFSFIGYNVNNHQNQNRISKKSSVKRDTNHTFDFNSRKVLQLKPLRRFPSGKNNKKFVVDWKRFETLQNFVRRSGQIIGQLEFKNYDILEKTTDMWHHRLVKAGHFEVDGFKRILDLLDNWLINKFRLDWIQNVGINELDYKSGCLVIEDTDPNAVFHFHGLRQLHYNRENFERSTPFVINSTNMGCLDVDKKIELFEKFGIVALQILDSCPYSRKVLIIDGRQPFDYVTDRDDIKFHSGDTLLYARIRYFIEEDHLKNLDKWFMEMGYHDVTEVGEFTKDLAVPEVTVNGCISTFYHFHMQNERFGIIKSILPLCILFLSSTFEIIVVGIATERRSVSLLRRSVGKFSVSSSRDCECKRESSAVRVDATNTNLENIDLPKLTRSENCDRLVTVYGEKNALPKYSESSWMEILDDDHKEGISKKHTILDRIESEDLLSRSRFVTEYNKIEDIIFFLENSVERNDERKWNKLVTIRKELRKAALKAFGDGESILVVTCCLMKILYFSNKKNKTKL
ncbi:Protein CBG13033 [Caenorhabditis briggsae]|uniref:Protein CBG13033 n=1 Tax=Caenorhabditis briggsae TaxID=6238 RepID=A8XGX4_CAEBR|nr:Protein CBG13033 [Caenorhabditis briggsae]CAP31898.2 Protein CBG13033 [Caenorhabditis briggsae]